MSQFIHTLPTGSIPICLSLKVVSLMFLFFILISIFLSMFPLMFHFFLPDYNITLVLFSSKFNFFFEVKNFPTKLRVFFRKIAKGGGEIDIAVCIL